MLIVPGPTNKSRQDEPLAPRLYVFVVSGIIFELIINELPVVPVKGADEEDNFTSPI